MRSIALEKYGPPQELKVLDLPKPQISKPDQILIKVHAASINPVDLFIASGGAKMMLPTTYVQIRRN